MKYNFDAVIDRNSTNAAKIEEMKEIWGREDLIPMWVADMDFATPDFVLDAVKKRCEHPILGYTVKPDSYYMSIINWCKSRYGMDVEKKNIHYVPGIVAGLGMAMNCYTSPGDKVVIMPPVYHPFARLTRNNNRQLVECPMKFENGEYRMNLDLFKTIKKGVRLLILCNPHNPGGVVWKKEELAELAEICAEDNILVFSDEIHADLTLPPNKHLPFAMVSEKAKNNSVTFMAPSKTFNMPGVAASHAIIFNETLLSKFEKYMEAGELGTGHVFAFPAVEAAFNNGAEWLEECLAYIQSNIDYVDAFMREHTPKIKVIRPQASYLLWLDCRDMGLTHEQLKSFFADKAHLALNEGEMFGREGSCFMRMNIGSPRCIIEKAMKQLAEAYKEVVS